MFMNDEAILVAPKTVNQRGGNRKPELIDIYGDFADEDTINKEAN